MTLASLQVRQLGLQHLSQQETPCCKPPASSTALSQVSGLATALYRSRWVRKGSLSPHPRLALLWSQERLTLQTSSSLPACDLKGLCRCMVSEGRIWSQSKEVSAAKGNSVALRAPERAGAERSPRDVQPCARCHAGLLRRADAHLANTSSAPQRKGRTSQEGRQKGERVCRNAQNGPATARFSELDLQMASAVLPMF